VRCRIRWKRIQCKDFDRESQLGRAVQKITSFDINLCLLLVVGGTTNLLPSSRDRHRFDPKAISPGDMLDTSSTVADSRPTFFRMIKIDIHGWSLGVLLEKNYSWVVIGRHCMPTGGMKMKRRQSPNNEQRECKATIPCVNSAEAQHTNSLPSPGAMTSRIISFPEHPEIKCFCR
jgi:hypothetical protein